MTSNTSVHLRLGQGGEFDGIRDLLDRWGDAARGIGDDAATIDIPRGERLVASVDTFVAGRHFEPAWITPREIGYRAVSAALSDLAAMAAQPLGVLLALAVPDAWRQSVGEIADGVGDAVRAAHTTVAGGNISAAGELSITTTVLGHCYAPLARDGADVGNHVYVTGALGGPGAAIAAWRSSRQPSDEARARFARPVPRIAEARWLAEHGATSCIDISDGLAADAAHLAAASGHAIELYLDRVPRIVGVTAADAARSGEEYELLLTAADLDSQAFQDRFGIALTQIGSVVPGPSGVQLFDGGARVAAIAGHDHYSA